VDVESFLTVAGELQAVGSTGERPGELRRALRHEYADITTIAPYHQALTDFLRSPGFPLHPSGNSPHTA
jgi:hypothetical protein